MSLQLAEQFEANEQYKEAYEEYKKEYEKNPEDLGLMERLGHLSMILDNKEQAAGYYAEILKRDVTNPLAYEQLMTIYEETDKYKYYVYKGNKNSIEGKLEFAIGDFKRALSYAQQDEAQVVMTRLTLANLYRQVGDNLKAIDEYNMILEYDNLHEEIFLQLADIFVKEETYSSALDALNRAIEKGFDTPKVKEALAIVYLKSGSPEKAIEYTSDQLLKIQCLLEIGKTEEAYDILNSLPDEYKSIPRYYTIQAQYSYSSKDFDKALEHIEEYNKLQPNSALTYQMRALVYEEKNDKYNAHLNWGRYNMLRGNRDIAINEMLNAVGEKDDDVDVLFTLAQMLTENNDTNHAVEYYEKIAKLDPKNTEALRKLADFRESIGDYRTQADYLEKIYEIDKNSLPAMKELAKVYEKIKARDKALEIYSRYAEIATDPVEIKLAQDKIEKLEVASAGGNEEGLIDKIMKFFNK